MTLQKRSFISGLLYLSLAVIGPFAFLVMPSQFTGAQSISGFAIDNVSLIIVWLILDLVIIAIEIVLTWHLWKLFNVHDRNLSFIAFVLRMAMVLIMIVNAVFLLLFAIDGGTSATTYVPYHEAGIYVWQLLFAPHVFLLGYMVYRHLTTWWRYLGIVVMLGAIGYLVDSMNNLFAYDLSFMTILGGILLVFVTIGELGMAVALLLKKVVPAS